MVRPQSVAATFVAPAAARSVAAIRSTNTTSLASVCTADYVSSVLPAAGSIDGLGITFDTSSVTANAVYNYSTTDETMWPDASFDFCNVTFSYSHDGLDGDSVILKYWLPSPANYASRFLATGGQGLAITSDEGNLPGGVMYGAVAGTTDGGFGGFSGQITDVYLLANYTINYEALFMFAYRGIGEMTQIGKAFSRNFFGQASDAKVYTYYQSCSEGGREGWSQVQRYGSEYDGVIAGAPAMRQAQLQVGHLFPSVAEQTIGYYPPSCEFDKIVNATIEACDPLDGRTDGVISRSDLCKLHFNVSSLVGLPYSCAASSSSSLGFGFGNKKRQSTAETTPAQNGTITAEGAAVVATFLDGMRDSNGGLATIAFQPGAEINDGATTYDSTTATWGVDIPATGGSFVTYFIELIDVSTISSLDNVTYDTLKDWMIEAWDRYDDTLQTTLPDLTPFQSNGGKVIHFHGEQDDSVPTGSSVHYYESVRSVMYSGLSYNESVAALNDWYRLYLIPGAAHCDVNSLQPNGPFPNTNMAVMIDWVENDVTPVTLNATYPSGIYEGESADICSWPLRPYWSDNSTMNCVYDQPSIDTWMYDFTAYNMPLY